MRKPRAWTLFLETLVVKTRRKGFENICGIQLLRWSVCALEKRRRQRCKEKEPLGWCLVKPAPYRAFHSPVASLGLGRAPFPGFPHAPSPDVEQGKGTELTRRQSLYSQPLGVLTPSRGATGTFHQQLLPMKNTARWQPCARLPTPTPIEEWAPPRQSRYTGNLPNEKASFQQFIRAL